MDIFYGWVGWVGMCGGIFWVSRGRWTFFMGEWGWVGLSGDECGWSLVLV